LSTFAGSSEAALYEKSVESNLQEYFARGSYHESASTRISAKC
jgi:hypothetical protein